MFRFCCAVFLSGILSSSLCAQNIDTISVDLEKAKETYRAKIQEARKNLLAEYDEKISEIAKGGHLQEVKAILAEKEAFERNSVLPKASKHPLAVRQYLASAKKAKSMMALEYEKAVSLYTKSLNIAKAEQVDAEAKLFAKAEISKSDSNQASKTGLVSLKAFGTEDLFICHGDFLGRVCKIDDNANKENKRNATFEIVPGLGSREQISLRSLNYDDRHFKHEDYQIKLIKIGPDKGSRENATFKMAKGLADESAVSFESFNYPSHYLRNKKGVLHIEKSDGSKRFNSDATFVITKALSETPSKK